MCGRLHVGIDRESRHHRPGDVIGDVNRNDYFAGGDLGTTNRR